MVHPVLQVGPAPGPNISCVVKHAFAHLEVCLGLAHHRNVKIREDVPEMLLGHRLADSPGGDADDPSRFSRPRTLAGRAGAAIERVLEQPGIERLYSGETKRKPFAALISLFILTTAGAGARRRPGYTAEGRRSAPGGRKIPAAQASRWHRQVSG